MVLQKEVKHSLSEVKENITKNFACISQFPEKGRLVEMASCWLAKHLIQPDVSFLLLSFVCLFVCIVGCVFVVDVVVVCCC